jgi:ABC-2 type transport system ATP-binding protein/lipopolysaccharide transport system ATP-binding protein
MKALIQRTRILVLASHSDALITAMCNRAMLLEKGSVIAIGQVDDILDRYHKRLTPAQVA